MITTTIKSTEQPWVLKWHPLLLTFFLVISRPTLWKMLHFNPTLGLSDVDVSLTNDGNIPGNIMGDKLLLNSTSFPGLFPWRFHNCHDNGSIAQRQDGVEVNDEDVLCRTTAILEIFIEDTIGNL